jgi:hypothetical protein
MPKDNPNAFDLHASFQEWIKANDVENCYLIAYDAVSGKPDWETRRIYHSNQANAVQVWREKNYESQLNHLEDK